MFKKLIFLFTIGILLSACAKSTPSQKGQIDAEKETSEPLQVVTTFYPIYDFTRKIAADEAEVKNIVPPGIEPHDYEPSPREMQQTYEADLLIYNGAGVDPWLENIVEDLEKNGVHLLNMSDYVTLIEGGNEDHEHEEDHEGDDHKYEEDEMMPGEHENEENEHDHNHGNLPYDPHFWLDPVLAQNQADAIRDALIEMKPEAKTVFETNTKALKDQLIGLHQSYESGLKNCTQSKAIVTHDAFGYLENRYRIDLLPISGLSPDEEPSAKALAELADLSKSNKIKYVFFETLASPKLAETLAEEIGATTMVLNPIEGLTQEEENQGKDYFSLMEQNLENLKLAMECQ